MKKAQFINVSRGSMYFSSDKGKTSPFTMITGTISNLVIKDDEFQGDKFRVCYLAIKTEDGREAVMSVRTDAGYFGNLISFLSNVDVTRQLTIHCSENVLKTGNIGSSLFVEQDGVFAKGYFKKDTETALPKWNPVKVSGKTLWDKTEYLEALEKHIQDKLVPHIPKSGGGVAGVPMPTIAPVTESVQEVESDSGKVEPQGGSSTEEDEEDLPF